jgi:hypothetical protein
VFVRRSKRGVRCSSGGREVHLRRRSMCQCEREALQSGAAGADERQIIRAGGFDRRAECQLADMAHEEATRVAQQRTDEIPPPGELDE